MTYRTTAGLLAAVVLAAVAWQVLDRRVADTEARRLRSRRIIPRNLASATALGIERGGARLRLVRAAEGWRLATPVAARAMEGPVLRLLAVLETLERHEVITAAQREHRGLGLEDYGLLSPTGMVEVVLPAGSFRLLIGREAPVGPHVYVKYARDTDVIATGRALLDALPDGVDALRDRRLLAGRPAMVTRLELERLGAGFVQVTRGEGGWTLQQPVREPADGTAVNALLETLFAARVEAFVWDPPPGADATAALPGETYGLAVDVAPVRVRVWVEGDETSRELVVGKAADDEGKTVYARLLPALSVVTVDAGLRDRLSVTANALRRRELVAVPVGDVVRIGLARGDRRLELAWDDTAGWSLVEPGQWPADTPTVRAWLDALAGLRCTDFVDADAAAPGMPDVTIRLGTRAGGGAGSDGEPAWAAVLDFAPAPTGGVGRLVRVSGRPGLMRVPGASLAVLGEDPLDPRYYLDRVMLAVDPATVQRLAVRRPAGTQTIARDAAGNPWTADGADTPGTVRTGAVSDILFRLANLRAIRVAQLRAPDLAAYGLAEPHASLTVGLSGGSGVLKTIRFGAPAPGGGRWAMVQGRDMVFVLDRPTVETLLQDLTDAPASGDRP